MCYNYEHLVLDLELSFVGRFLSFIYPWFGRAGTRLLQLAPSVLYYSALIILLVSYIQVVRRY